MFANITKIDAANVLMLLGEGTIWKALWSRMRAQRHHWTHYVFTISPGWVPLSGSIFAAMSGGFESPNLIYDRIPEGCTEPGLRLINLNSGAIHAADNTLLQTIWIAWKRGNYQFKRNEHQDAVDLSRELGVVDLDLDLLTPKKNNAILLQAIGLLAQIALGAFLAVSEDSGELAVVLCANLLGQLLTIWATVPRSATWERATRKHRPVAVLLHKGMDSSDVLLVRNAWLRHERISLEEYCWDTRTFPNQLDKLRLIGMGAAFILCVFSIIMISWMNAHSKLLYLFIGAIGLLSNAIDATLQPDWLHYSEKAFTGVKRCAPKSSSLLASVAVLIAGGFPAANITAKHLFPDNARFRHTLDKLENEVVSQLCGSCKMAISSSGPWTCQRGGGLGLNRIPNQDPHQTCFKKLAMAAEAESEKQMSDALATLSHLLAGLADPANLKRIATAYKTEMSPPHAFW